ncbi:MAG TPA: hypothetical protein VFL59_02430 [Candidatus Nanopelagicales bacterium]|nr:hypothetical protein [Candidatus Nanopelagicales bacterium]
MIAYVCQMCGYEGVDRDEDDLDRVLCSQCGEPPTERRRDPEG